MNGRIHTFIVSLYCTLMVWSAFMSIGRGAFSAAGIGAQVVERVQGAMAKGLPAIGANSADDRAARATGTVPDASVGHRVAQTQPVNTIVSFPAAVESVRRTSGSVDAKLELYSRFGIDNGGRPWPVFANHNPEQTSAIMAGRRDDIVLLLNKDAQTNTYIYVCDSNGVLQRAYDASHGDRQLPNAEVSADKLNASFKEAKDILVRWVLGQPAVTSQTGGSTGA